VCLIVIKTNFIRIGPAPYAWIITFTIILALVIFSDATTIFYVSKKSSFVIFAFMVMLQMLTLATLLITSLMDPGYLPRRNFVKVVNPEQSELAVEEEDLTFFNHYIYYQAR
jgi:hypothetical protein